MSSLSLEGKRVLVPRGKKSAKSFSEMVVSFEGTPVEIPLLGFRPAKTDPNLKNVLQSLHTYNWLIFTSNVTVETFFSFLDHVDPDCFFHVAAIGEKTEDALRRKGISVDFRPRKYVAEEFSVEFAPLVNSGDKILIPKGNLARDYIAQFLREKGAIVDEVVIYETYFPEESKKALIRSIKADKLDILPFTSPSTVEHFMNVVNEYQLQDHIRNCIVACIGPVTKQMCESHGLPVHVMPDKYTVYEMLIGVCSYINQLQEKQ